MARRLKDAVIEGYPSKVPPEKFPTYLPRTAAEAIVLLEGLRPTAGNLPESESWRRMIGGRNRYNHRRQQIAEARRAAIFLWLLEYRMNLRSNVLGVQIPLDRIEVRHGDGAMLAKALHVGRSTLSRDLSALQAVNPAVFGRPNVGISYEEYMSAERYARRTHIGSEQPAHNLRFPANQRGPKARSLKAALGCGQVASLRMESEEPTGETNERPDKPESDAALPTTDDFLRLLKQNCPPQELPKLAHQILRRRVSASAV